MKLPMMSEGVTDEMIRPFHQWQDEDTEVELLPAAVRQGVTGAGLQRG
jgi:hypothetical protein